MQKNMFNNPYNYLHLCDVITLKLHFEPTNYKIHFDFIKIFVTCHEKFPEWNKFRLVLSGYFPLAQISRTRAIRGFTAENCRCGVK